MPLACGTRLGPYEITASLGAGGMGEVYKGRDTRLDRTVAIKVIPASLAGDPELRQRLEREARAISALDHPHICGLYDVGREGPTDYLVMQYLEGTTLAARLERGPLAVDEALRVCAQIADALAAAHRFGIVHRDLKPGNIMLTSSGARLLDFGLAKRRALATSSGAAVTAATPLTADRSIVGTLYYMAPEQLEGQEADERSDLFALGAVLYEAVTGARAFDGDSQAGVIAAVLTTNPRPIASRLGGAPARLSRAVERCLAKRPDDRWQSAADLAYELTSIRSDAGVDRPADATPPARGPAGTWKWIAVVAAAAVIPSTAALLLTSRGDGDQRPELRLSVVAPPDQEFGASVSEFDPEFALSPDGTQIAFIATDAAGVPRLWVRPLSSLVARALAGTEGASRPFWSPDGAHIGYAGPAGLTRVPVAGGAPQVIAATGGRALLTSASWGARHILADRMVSSNETDAALQLVPDSGGAAVPVPRGKHQALEISQRYPTLLPDGRRFIYLSWTADPEQRAIYLGSLDSEERTLLVRSRFKAAYVEPGLLLYVRDRSLVAQKLSLDPPRLEGEPRVVIERLTLEAIPGQATYAASLNGVVAFRERTQDVASELRWMDQDGRVVGVAAQPASDITVSLSPDGRRAAVTRLNPASTNEERVPGNIWLIDLGRRLPTRFTIEADGVYENPVWSPDGAKVAYAVHRGGGLAEVRIQPAMATGGGTVAIASGQHNFHPIHWSPDGKHLLLHAYGGSNRVGPDQMGLWLWPGSGEPKPYQAGEGLNGQGQFSPDGRWVAFSSDQGGAQQVFVRPFPSGDERWQISSEGGGQPRWSRDGREIYYVSPGGTVMAVEVKPSGTELNPQHPAPLFTEPSLRVTNELFFYGGAAAYDVAPDGRFLVNRLTREPHMSAIHVVLNGIR